MIAQLSGKFLYKNPTRVVVDVNGVGYEVNISLHTYSAISALESGTLFTHLKISEEAFTLWGFAEEAEKEIFLKLIGVSGVGAATARMMVSSLKPREIQLAIGAGNTKQLEAIKGIGKKTAERIVLELKDKIGIVAGSGQNFAPIQNTAEADALEALVALGISKNMAETAVRKVMSLQTETPPVEDIIKLALKSL